MTKYTHIVFSGLITILLSGCAMGPDYKAPGFDFPSWWHSSSAQKSKEDAPTQAPSLAWWKGFHDQTLDGLVDRASKNNQDLKIAEARIEEARASRQTTSSALYPEIKGDVLANDVKLPLGGNNIKSHGYIGALDASWEVDLFGSTRRAVEAADATIQARQADLHDAQITLVGDVARNYIEWRQLQQQIALTQQNVKAQRELYTIADTKYKAGTGSYLEASEAQTLTKNTLAGIPELERQREASGYRLSVLLGEAAGPLNNELKPIKSLPRPIAIPVLSAPADTIRSRPDVQAAERELASATALHAEAFTELFPKLSLMSFFGLAGEKLNQGAGLWGVTSSLSIPLLNFGRIQGDIKAADARQTQALAVYKKTVLGAISDIETNLMNVSKANARTVLLQDAVKSAKQTLSIARDRYNNGLATFTEVLDSEKALYSAQETSVQAQSDLLMYLIALHKALAVSE